MNRTPFGGSHGAIGSPPFSGPFGAGSVPSVSFDLDAPAEHYFTWDPPGGSGEGLNEGTNVGENCATTTVHADYGRVQKGARIDAGAGQALAYGCGIGTAGGVFTLATWVRFDSDVNADPHRFPLSANNGSGGWYMQRQGNLTMLFAQEGSGGAGNIWGTVPAFAAGVYVHVAVSVDAEGGDGARMYVNGALDGHTAGVWCSGAAGPPTGVNTGWPRFGVNWQGSLDEFVCVRRVLTPAEIARVYDAGVAGRKVTWP